jgi:nucleoside-diphosphate-sugar epimerase
MILLKVGQIKMRALLTGGTGFVGQNLQCHLQAQGWTVENIYRATGSRADIDLLMERFKPSVVIHLATLFIAEHKAADIPALIDSNITFGTQVVDSMVEHGVLNFINAGTLWQYYQGERDVPACLYAATKTAFESILRFYSSANNLRVINLMLSDTYGPRDPRLKLLPKLIRIAGTNEKIQLSGGEQSIAWTYISDIVAAFEVAALRLSSNHDSKIEKFAHYSATSTEVLSLRQSIRLCEDLLGKKIAVEFGAKPYRNREIMKPIPLDPPLPGWSAQIAFAQGLKEIFEHMQASA